MTRLRRGGLSVQFFVVSLDGDLFVAAFSKAIPFYAQP